MQAQLSERSFDMVAELFERESGIRLSPAKRPLVAGRLSKLAARRGLPSVDAYVTQLLQGHDAQELIAVVDALTTNETYFFREPKHFEFLAARLADMPAATPLRVWSAASSSGEEGYSIAMLLADVLGEQGRWEVLGTDLSSAMVAAARRALYPLSRAERITPEYRRRFCLKGEGPYAGHLLVEPRLRARVQFHQANLMEPLPTAVLGRFDVIFLRNVLIYFENDTKLALLRNVLTLLKPGGFLFVGHAETLNGFDLGLQSVQPAIYRKPARQAAATPPVALDMKA